MHALPWEPEKYSKIKQCDCAFSKLLPRFASIMAGEQFIGIKTLDLHIPEGSDLGIVEERLAQWSRKGSLKLSYTEDEDIQYNTLDSLRPLIWPRNR